MKQFVFERMDNFLTKYGHGTIVFFRERAISDKIMAQEQFFHEKSAKKHPIDFFGPLTSF